MQFTTVVVAALAAAVSAAPAPAPAALQKRDTTCGNTDYTTSQIEEAAQEACDHIEAGTQVGSNDYPHTYNNYEDFNFDVDGPYQSFPMLTSGVYTGGSPGADRVVINEDTCEIAGQITHTGATGNGFVGCDGTS